ncbi:MFS transporter, partial [Halorubrum saccharovorum]
FAVIGVTWAAIAVTAAALVTRLAPPAIRGEALGAYGALVAIGGGLGGIVGGWLASFGYSITFAAAGGTVVVGAGIVAALARRSERRSERQSDQRYGTGEEMG